MPFSLPGNITALTLRRLRSLPHLSRVMFLGAGVADALSWIFMLALLPKGREGVFALRYNVYYGITGIGSAWYLLWIPFAGAALLAVNMALAVRGARSNEGIPMLIAGVTLFLEMLLLIRSITVFFLNM